jgi:ComEC/Rec2-related protein
MAGAESLSPRYRSLYSGLVIGDDRTQPAGMADDFRGAGLTHLLAVSGQNVAFVLALAGPVVRRLRLWPRWFFTLGMIGMFGLVTRFEPSVLRASALAALATLVMTTGHSPARVTLLGWATVGLLVIDPLLVQSVGFRLSVAASAAIVVLAPRLLAVLPGPERLREALAVTVAAQLGVAPVLLATFGPIPVASLPANLLAVPVAGAIMVWGLTAGLLAGLAGPSVAWLLQIPTGAALAWLEGVAHHLARAGLGELGGGHVVALGAGLAVAAVGVGRGPWVRQAGLMVAGGAVLVAVVAGRAPPPLRASVATGVTVWRDGSTALVVLSDAGGGRSVGSAGVLEGLRRSGIDRIGLLVVADSSVPPEVVVDVLQGHPTTGVVTANPGSLGPVGAPVARPPLGGGMEVGHLALRITSLADRLVVDARPR